MKNRLINLLKLIVGIGLLYWLFHKLPDPASLWQQITHTNKGLLLLGACCYAAAVALSGLKWGILLRAIGIPVATPRLLAYQWVAEFFNNFLPAQVGGDVMRGYALASDTHRAADAAASVLIDRFIGLMVFMLASTLAAGGMLLFGKPDGAVFTGDALTFMRVAAVGSLAATLLLLSAVITLLSRRLKRLVERLLLQLPLANRLTPIWQKLAQAFDAYRNQGRALGLTALGSALIVVLTSVNIWLIANAIQPGKINLLEVLAINPIIVFALLIVPLSPGGLGVRQISFATLFSFIGAGVALGAAVGLLQQFIGYLVSLPGGLLWLHGRGGQPKPATLPTTTPIKPLLQ